MLGTHADMGKCGGVFIHKTESPGKPRSRPKPNSNQIPGSQTGSQTKNKYKFSTVQLVRCVAVRATGTLAKIVISLVRVIIQ